MISLAGLSAAYPGFQQAENTQATIQQNQNAAREGAIKLLAQQILGRAFTPVATPDAVRPMAPAPGQPSVPNQPAPAAPPPQQGGAPSAAPVPAAPAPTGPTGMPEISLQGLTQRILQTSPQVAQHPELLMAALERASPLLDRQSREDLADITRQYKEAQLRQREDIVRLQEQGRNDRASTAEAGRNDRAAGRNERTDRRLDQADAREARLASQSQVRQDQAWTRLDIQRQDLERRIQQGGDKQALAQWRAVVDAQHKRANEIIGANRGDVNLKKADRDALLAEQRKAYEEAISGMRSRMQNGGTTPAAPAPAPTSSPPVNLLREGQPTEFKNGQTWTLENGVAKRLK